jgi:hypothetical protein
VAHELPRGPSRRPQARAVKEIFPDLTDAQLKGVWALWAYHYTRERYMREDAVTSYLVTECWVPHVDDAKKAITALHQFDLCLF